MMWWVLLAALAWLVVWRVRKRAVRRRQDLQVLGPVERHRSFGGGGL